MQTFPAHWHPLVEITQLGRHGIENRETRKLVIGTHTGTHVDAPRHFVPDGQTIDLVQLSQLVGPALVIDLSMVAKFQELNVSDISAKVENRLLERVVLRFDWSDKFGTGEYYTDHPFLSEAAAHWLVDKGCRLLAMDTPMPDNPNNGRGCFKDSPNHKILLGNGVILVEYLTNLRALRCNKITLVVAPLKIEHGDGAPARVFAIEE